MRTVHALSFKWSDNTMHLSSISYLRKGYLDINCGHVVCGGQIGLIIFHDPTVQEELVPSPIQHSCHNYDTS